MCFEISVQAQEQGPCKSDTILCRITQARAIGFDLYASDVFFALAVAGDGITAAKKGLGWHRHAGAGSRGKSLLFEQCSEAQRAAQEVNVASITSLNDPTNAAGFDGSCCIERFVTIRQIECAMQIAKLHSRIGMTVAVQIDQKSNAELLHRCFTGCFDKRVVLLPRLLRQCIALRCFNDFTIRIQLAAVQTADHKMNVTSCFCMNYRRNRPRQFLRVRIDVSHSVGPIRNLFRGQSATVGRGDNQRQIAGDILNEVMLPKDASSRHGIFRTTGESHANENDGEQGLHQRKDSSKIMAARSVSFLQQPKKPRVG